MFGIAYRQRSIYQARLPSAQLNEHTGKGYVPNEGSVPTRRHACRNIGKLTILLKAYFVRNL